MIQTPSIFGFRGWHHPYRVKSSYRCKSLIIIYLELLIDPLSYKSFLVFLNFNINIQLGIANPFNDNTIFISIKYTRSQVLFISMASISTSIYFTQSSSLITSSKFVGSYAINAKFETWSTSSYFSYNYLKLVVFFPNEANAWFYSLLTNVYIACCQPTLECLPWSWVLGVINYDELSTVIASQELLLQM